MNDVVQKALALWGMDGADCTLVADRENQVFRVKHGSNSFALRLHRVGYRTNAELKSELEWMNALSSAGLRVPRPVVSCDQKYQHIVDEIQVDILAWMSGSPLGNSVNPIAVENRNDAFFRVGVEMARLHQMSDDWSAPNDFDRWSWNAAGLVGNAPVWGRFWENPSLKLEEREILTELRDAAATILEEEKGQRDFGLIHADMVKENVLVDGENISVLDFDDGGFGYRIFDLATVICANRNEPDIEQLQAELLRGYRTHRSIDTIDLQLFLALRAATYVGWIIDRIHEKGGVQRNRKFIDAAVDYSRSFLSS